LPFLVLRSEQQFTGRHIDELAPQPLSLAGIDMKKWNVRLANPARSAEKVKLRNEPKNRRTSSARHGLPPIHRRLSGTMKFSRKRTAWDALAK
jgi:hypothetical protein